MKNHGGGGGGGGGGPGRGGPGGGSAGAGRRGRAGGRRGTRGGGRGRRSAVVLPPGGSRLIVIHISRNQLLVSDFESNLRTGTGNSSRRPRQPGAARGPARVSAVRLRPQRKQCHDRAACTTGHDPYPPASLRQSLRPPPPRPPGAKPPADAPPQ